MWCSLLNLHYVREEINRLLYLKEGLCHLAIKCKFITQNKIPWGCSCAIYKVSSIDVRSRWIIRLRDMTPSLKKYRVIKVVFLHVSDSKIIKIIKFSSSFVWFVDWTDSFILEGGHWNFRYLRSVFVPKNFGFSDCVFIAVCGFSVHWHLVFGFRQKYLSNGLWIWSLIWFSDFPTWILVSLRPKRSLCASSDLEKPRNLCVLHLSTLSRID